MAQIPIMLPDEEKDIASAEQISNRSASHESQNSEKKDEEKLPDPCQDDASVACGDIKFKSLEWWQCGMIMIAETVSLGILSLPSVLSTVGLIPGFILILGLGIFATYSGYAIGQFKDNYPNVQSMGDAFEILCKPLGFPNVGKEIGGGAQTLFLVFSMAGHILTWIICFNAITDHAVCNVVWGIIALIVFWLFDLPRTLRNMSYWSIACKYFSFSHDAMGVPVLLVNINNCKTSLTSGSICQYCDSCHRHNDRRSYPQARTRSWTKSLHALATGRQANCLLESFPRCHQYCFCIW
jgi:hypothetical protein